MTQKQRAELSEQQARDLLQADARYLSANKDEIMRRWTDAFRSSVAKPPGVTYENLIDPIIRLFEQFLDYLQRGQVDDYLEKTRAVAKAYAEGGFPYANLALAVRIFETACGLRLQALQPSRGASHQDALRALHQFNLKLLSELSSSYVETAQAILQRRHMESLAEESRRREQLLAMAVHDLRGPLTSILGFSQLIEKALALGRSCNPKEIEIIIKESRRLRKMVDELADLSMVEAGRLELEREPTDIVALARQVVDALRQTTTSHPLVLETPDTPMVGSWDAKRLSQMLSHLVESAMKLSPERAQVIVSLQPSGNRAEAAVSMPGVEIPQDLIHQVLQPFSRYYRERRIKGMGMGLFIAKGIVEAHGGAMWVESEPGLGARFVSVLPFD